MIVTQSSDRTRAITLLGNLTMMIDFDRLLRVRRHLQRRNSRNCHHLVCTCG
jgi:hypothetical protein